MIIYLLFTDYGRIQHKNHMAFKVENWCKIQKGWVTLSKTKSSDTQIIAVVLCIKQNKKNKRTTGNLCVEDGIQHG